MGKKRIDQKKLEKFILVKWIILIENLVTKKNFVEIF